MDATMASVTMFRKFRQPQTAKNNASILSPDAILFVGANRQNTFPATSMDI